VWVCGWVVERQRACVCFAHSRTCQNLCRTREIGRNLKKSGEHSIAAHANGLSLATTRRASSMQAGACDTSARRPADHWRVPRRGPGMHSTRSSVVLWMCAEFVYFGGGNTSKWEIFLEKWKWKIFRAWVKLGYFMFKFKVSGDFHHRLRWPSTNLLQALDVKLIQRQGQTQIRRDLLDVRRCQWIMGWVLARNTSPTSRNCNKITQNQSTL